MKRSTAMSLIPAAALASIERRFESIGIAPEWPNAVFDTRRRLDYARYVADAKRRRQAAFANAGRGALRAVGAWFGRRVAAWRAARERDRALTELSRLDDLSLHDMGLTRSTIWHAVHAGREAPAAANENILRAPRAA
jgi:uncharacterized protein YjiS (DUF1127 family)